MNVKFQSSIAPDHPALTGHFPGNPVVPGVLIIEEVLRAFGHWRHDVMPVGVVNTKFRRPISPGAMFSIVFGAERSGSIRFECRLDDTAVVTGVLTFASEDAPTPDLD